MEEKLLNLPLHIQITLGSGYLAYLIAYAGIRQHHTAAEVFFRSIAFGMAATAVMLWSPEGPDFLNSIKHPVWRPVIAVSLTVFIGIFWRWRGMQWTKSALSAAKVSWTDDIPTAWLSITATDTKCWPAQIAVDLDNGRTLVCDDTRQFKGMPHAPCILGLDGSIAMYVTGERRQNDEWIEFADVNDHEFGSRLTYLPASVIKRVELRLARDLPRRPWWRRCLGWARRRRWCPWRH